MEEGGLRGRARPVLRDPAFQLKSLSTFNFAYM